MLRDLHLLDDLPQGSTVPGAVLAGDPDLLGTLGLKCNQSMNDPGSWETGKTVKRLGNLPF